MKNNKIVIYVGVFVVGVFLGWLFFGGLLKEEIDYNYDLVIEIN